MESRDEALKWVNSKISELCRIYDFERNPYITTDDNSQSKKTTPTETTGQFMTPFHHLLQMPKNDSIKKSAISISSSRGTMGKTNNKRVPNTIIIGQRPPASEHTQARSYSQTARSRPTDGN
jgi:hypothetical protein